MGHNRKIIKKLEPVDCYVAMTRPRKKRKKNKVSPITIGYLTRKPGTWKKSHISRLRVLFDSGCEATLVNAEKVKGLPKMKSQPVSWTTKAGSFKTKERCQLRLKLPSFFENKEIEWNAYVDPSEGSSSRYDLIIGRDLMLEAGIDIKFSEEKVVWESAEISMQHPGFLDEPKRVDLLEKELMYLHDPLTTEADRIQAILDAKYTKADLEKEVAKCTNLKKGERLRLKKLLKIFGPLFDGTLGE